MNKQEFLELMRLAYLAGIDDTLDATSKMGELGSAERAEELMQEFIDSGDLTYEFPCESKDKTDYVKLSMLVLRTVNQIDDYFEYGNESQKDKKVVMRYIDELTEKLKTV